MPLWSPKPFIALRILGADGNTPALNFCHEGHAFVATEDIAWCAVIQPALPQDWLLSEITGLVPQEIRLLAAVTLCEADPWNKGLPILTHTINTHVELFEGDDLRKDATLDRIANIAGKLAHDARVKRGSYPVRTDMGSEDDALQILANFPEDDELLLAGTARLLECNRVESLGEPNAAALSLFVSLGASLEYLRYFLQATRVLLAPPPIKDVIEYLSELYPKGFELKEYLEEVNAKRVIAIHPSSSHGEYWTPPLMADDLYFLRKHVVQLYRHILLEERPVISEPFFDLEESE